jgi:phosphoribosylformylglycinamidine (FGAM) synthase PurS component
MVSNVRSGQYLRFYLKAENDQKAKGIIEDLLNKLRIFNPVTQNFKILNLTKGNGN